MNVYYANRFAKEKCEMFFQHTSSRWICNEKIRLAERYATFNVGALIRIAVQATGSKRCINVVKLTEGTYYRTFILTMDNRYEVMARISLLTYKLSASSICSEVATMDYLRNHLPIPIRVPKVFAWEHRFDNNPVGLQYMVMEYMRGDNLQNRWPCLSSDELSEVIQQLVTIESRIFACKFPKYGSLYYVEHVEEKYRVDLIKNRFCVGPMAGNEWWPWSGGLVKIDRGPWLRPEDYLKACAQREAACTARIEKPGLPQNNTYTSGYRFGPDDHISLLSKYEQVVPYLIPRGKDQFSSPTLRHFHLSLENIILDKSSKRINGIIDWNNASIIPYFVQSGIPPLVCRHSGKHPGRLEIPEPPDNDENIRYGSESLRAKWKLREERAILVYKVTTLLKNPRHLRAIELPQLAWRQNLIRRAGKPCNGDMLLFRRALIEFREIWNDIYPSTPYPFPGMFTEEEKAINIEESERWEQVQATVRKIHYALHVDKQGGLDPHYQYERACQLNVEYRIQIAKQQASSELAEALWRLWPFKDNDDNSSPPELADSEWGSSPPGLTPDQGGSAPGSPAVVDSAGRRSAPGLTPDENGSAPGSPAVVDSAGRNSARGLKRKGISSSPVELEGTRPPAPVDLEEQYSRKRTKLKENGSPPAKLE